MTLEARLRAAYRGKHVLLTGHTGFKGAWLALWLEQLGAEVHGLALAPDTSPSLFDVAAVGALCKSSKFVDVRDAAAVERVVRDVAPEVVFHLAAQPLVRRSYADPVGTFDTNVGGTMHVLDAVRTTKTRAAIVAVTTDKVYENREWAYAYRENDALGGHDPYAASKAAAEIVIGSYRKSFFAPSRLADHGVALASARAGNVIGGGDWAEDRILPDCVRALGAGQPIEVRNPASTRPWQHVIEPIAGYLTLGAHLLGADGARFAEAYNLGPGTEPPLDVRGVVETAIAAWGGGTWVDRSDPNAVHEAGRLRLSIERAASELAWLPRWDSREAVRRTVAWYRAHHDKRASARELCLGDIRDYLGACEAS